MSPEEQQLVLSLVTQPDGSRRLEPDEFLRRFGATDGRSLGLQLLQDALRRQGSWPGAPD